MIKFSNRLNSGAGFRSGGLLPSGVSGLQPGEVPLIAQQGTESTMPDDHQNLGPDDPKTHDRHAGKCGDVFKHFALAALLDHYAKQCPDDHPILYLDSHAGRGLYNMGGRTDRAIFEVPVDEMPSAFWCVAKRTFPSFYPGSPALADGILRENDRLILCETNSTERDLLQKYVPPHEDVNRLDYVGEDGYQTVPRILGLYPSPAYTSILFLDPTYEDPDDWTRVAEAAWISSELRPRTLHTVIVWYPLLEGHHSEVDMLHRKLARVAHSTGGTLLHQEVRVGREPGSNMIGAGMFFVKVLPGTQQALQRALVAGNGIYGLHRGNLFGRTAP